VSSLLPRLPEPLSKQMRDETSGSGARKKSKVVDAMRIVKMNVSRVMLEKARPLSELAREPDRDAPPTAS
jgi:hypothetical protein